jgi:MauM/NapG family ferredoxin protein
MGLLGIGVIGGVVFKFLPSPGKNSSKLIRPPGSTEKSLEQKCIRCGECARVCPTATIQPLNSAWALGSAWSPYLALRHAFCDYSCNACGQVCPTRAISNLSLEDKRKYVIGLAVIDEKRCIAFASNRECYVCQRACPLSQSAITLKSDGGLAQKPYVDENLCNGCGACEHDCPVEGESAIRVVD